MVEKSMPSVLMIDDDISLCELISEYLTEQGFDTDVAYDGETGLLMVSKKTFDVIILDIMMPQMNGFRVLKSLSTVCKTPVIMLTAKGKDLDQIIAFEIGAEDYIDKPCNPRVLLARITKILERSDKSEELNRAPELTIGNLTLIPSTRSAKIDSKTITLTNTEFNLLKLLMTNVGESISKETLTQKALGRELTAFDRSIDVHIHRLRNKLRKEGVHGCNIVTIHGFGYRLEEDA